MDDELTLPEVPGDEVGAPDFETTYKPEIKCEGRYEVDPIPGGKRFQGTWLVLDDGTRYVLSYRPDPDYYRFIDKRVSVTGRPYTPGRDTQHILAAHFQVISMELAPGEVPYVEPPTHLPAPPLLRTADEIRPCAGHWGQVVGRLVALKNDEDTHFSNAYLELEDGAQITACYAAEGQWKSFLGRTVTVISRIEVGTDAKGCEEGEVVLTGWYAVSQYVD